MKKTLPLLSALCAVFFLFSACSDFFGSSKTDNSDNDNNGDSTNATANIDEQVQTVFDLTNEFRTGSEAYYWNSDNTTKTNLVGQLAELTLDEDLCKAAQIRANEIVSNFSHTRPDGTSCFTVLSELSISYSTCGENIAAGNQSGEKTFLQWKEDDANYSGQGHRRNMLGKDFTRIGIAYSYDASSTYKYYWTMILAN